MIRCLLMLLGFCTAAFSFTFPVNAHEFRLRANHIFWKNQEAGTEKEIDFGRGVAAKILGKYPIFKDEEKVNYVSQIGTGISAQLGRPELRYYFGILDTDDINGYAEGRGISGLTGPEIQNLIDGGLDSIYLLFRRPAFKIMFKTPIPFSFTEVNLQTELSQAPLNYLSHGSSSIQTDIRNWKNKVAFKLLKNQLNLLNY